MLFAGYAEVPSFVQNGFTSLPLRQAFALKKDAPEPKPATPPASMARRTVTAAGPGRLPARPVAAAPMPFAPLRPAVLTPALTPTLATRSGTPVRTSTPSAPQERDLLEQARALADRGQFKEAGVMCRSHLAAVPESAEAYFILGILSEHEQQMTAAEDNWRRCIYLQPDHYEALCHLALLAEQNGNHSGATALKARAARIYQRQRAS
jgi:chemotaxis protein methyltransferase WspC